MKEITDLLISLYLYDIEVLSRPWMYYWLCIPALAYIAFFMVKWSVLTAPIWIPLAAILRAGKND
jgi:hypothetical protein